MNMVRAGVVKHPSQWEFCGYNEIQNPIKRKGIIGFDRLMDLPGFENYDDLKDTQGWCRFGWGLFIKEVVIAKNNLPLVDIVPHKPEGKRTLGLLCGKLKVPDDIMAEDEEINEMFYGSDK